jgi:hypothetical protein
MPFGNDPNLFEEQFVELLVEETTRGVSLEYFQVQPEQPRDPGQRARQGRLSEETYDNPDESPWQPDLWLRWEEDLAALVRLHEADLAQARLIEIDFHESFYTRMQVLYERLDEAREARMAA